VVGLGLGVEVRGLMGEARRQQNRPALHYESGTLKRDPTHTNMGPTDLLYRLVVSLYRSAAAIETLTIVWM
jgi:hypothetical protein